MKTNRQRGRWQKLATLGKQEHAHLIPLLLFAVLAIAFVGYKVYQTPHAAALVDTKTAPPQYPPPISEQLFGKKFSQFVKGLKPVPAKTVSTNPKAGTVTKVSKSATKVLKGGVKAGTGTLGVATILIFAENTDASPREISAPGAATDEYQHPAPGNKDYSSKHSFSIAQPNYSLHPTPPDFLYQYYVRVHVVTGSESNPTVTNTLPWPTRVKFSSKQRGDHDGCGTNYDRKWRDSYANFNAQGWAYFPDCQKNDTFDVSFEYLPKNLENAKIVRTLSAVGKDGLTINLDYYIINFDKPVSKRKPATPKPAAKKTVPKTVSASVAKSKCKAPNLQASYRQPADEAKLDRLGRSSKNHINAKQKSALLDACYIGYQKGYADAVQSFIQKRPVRGPPCVTGFPFTPQPPGEPVTFRESQKIACDKGYHAGESFGYTELEKKGISR